MIYTLMFWITSCVGPSCEIPGVETEPFESLIDCKVALVVKQVMHPRTVGFCVEGHFERIGEDIFNVGEE